MAKPNFFIIKENGGITVYSNTKDINFYFIDNDSKNFNSAEEQEEQNQSKKEFGKSKNNLHILYTDF